LGPVMYFYVQSLLNPSFRFGRKEALHFAPAVAYLVFVLLVFVTDKLVLHQYWFLASGVDPDFAAWYQLSGFASMLVYTLLALRYFRLFRRLMLQVTSFADRLQFSWVRHFLLAFSVMLFLRACFYILALFGIDNYSDSWWYYLGFATLFYFIAIRGYGNSRQASVAYQLLGSGEGALILGQDPESIADQIFVAEEIGADTAILPDPETEALKFRLVAIMESDSPYKDPALDLGTLSRRLGIPSGQLSRLVNRGFGCNFNDYINGYRIRAVQAAIAAGEHRRQTLLGIAYDCGFNSKATFNRAFLKSAGMTPRAFMQAESRTGSGFA
jgi:AraC-like DNA-binding protein